VTFPARAECLRWGRITAYIGIEVTNSIDATLLKRDRTALSDEILWVTFQHST
jgi:hypothetical protein